MSKIFRCNVRFDTRTTHSVDIAVFKTRRAMLRHLKREGCTRVDKATEAVFWEDAFPAQSGIIGCMFFFRGSLTVNTIAHESSHAAFCRAKVIGLKVDDRKDFEECVATSAGNLTENAIAWLGVSGQPVKFEIGYSRKTRFTIDKLKKV